MTHAVTNITYFYKKSKFDYRIYRIMPLDPILSHMLPIYVTIHNSAKSSWVLSSYLCDISQACFCLHVFSNFHSLLCVCFFMWFGGITVNLGGLGLDRIRTCRRLKTLRINYLYCLTYIMQCNKERILVKYKCYKWLKVICITKKNKQ